MAGSEDLQSALQRLSLESGRKGIRITAMKLILAIAVWLMMGVLISAGLILALHGSPWLLIISLLGFVLGVAKIGCLSH